MDSRLKMSGMTEEAKDSEGDGGGKHRRPRLLPPVIPVFSFCHPRLSPSVIPAFSFRHPRLLLLSLPPLSFRHSRR